MVAAQDCIALVELAALSADEAWTPAALHVTFTLFGHVHVHLVDV